MKPVCVLTFLHINWTRTGANMHWCYELTVWHQKSQYTVIEYIEQNCFQATVSSFLQDTWSRASQISLGLLGKEVFLFFFLKRKLDWCVASAVRKSRTVQRDSHAAVARGEVAACHCTLCTSGLTAPGGGNWRKNSPFLKLFSSVTDECRTSGCLSFSSSLSKAVKTKTQWAFAARIQNIDL